MGWLALNDPFFTKQAKDRLRNVQAAKPEPKTTEELIRRVHERPHYVPRLASALQQGLRDNDPRQWNLWLGVARGIAAGLIEAEEVLRMLGYALAADKPAHYFARSWKRLGI